MGLLRPMAGSQESHVDSDWREREGKRERERREKKKMKEERKEDDGELWRHESDDERKKVKKDI
jgi:hypothetical protein